MSGRGRSRRQRPPAHRREALSQRIELLRFIRHEIHVAETWMKHDIHVAETGKWCKRSSCITMKPYLLFLSSFSVVFWLFSEKV